MTNVFEKEKKIIFNIFLCNYEEDNSKWRNHLAIFYGQMKPNIDWWVKPQIGNDNGLGFQAVLNEDNMDNAQSICELILDEFKGDVLMVISDGMVRKTFPIDENVDKDFLKPSKLFDKLIRKKVKGIYILNQ